MSMREAFEPFARAGARRRRASGDSPDRMSSDAWTLGRFTGRTGFEVLRADAGEIADLLFRFRYHVYVQLLGRRRMVADHARRLVRDPLDEHGENYVALQDGVIVGAVRRNRLDDPAARYYAKVYRAELFEPAPLSAISITTRLVMLPELRGSDRPAKLIQHAMRDAYRQDIRVDVIDCDRHLIEFFEGLGYFSYMGSLFHKEFGTVRPMFHALDAVGYRARIGTPLGPARDSPIADGGHGGYGLIGRLAQTPRNARIRALSEHLRSSPGILRRPGFWAEPARDDGEPSGGGGR